MKIAIMGAGGIGGFYGGRMAKAGQDVVFIARGAHLEALRSKGLRVESQAIGDFEISTVQATDDPGSVGAVDVVFCCVKAYGLEEAARAMAPMVGGNTVVIPLLNGVEIAERLGAVVGMDAMLGGCAFVSANIVEPGTIRHQAMDRLIFGELGGGTSPRAEAVHAMLAACEIPAELSPDIRKEIWTKFVVFNAFSGACSVTRLPGKALVDDPDTRALFMDAMQEVMDLAERQGIALDSDLPAKFASMADGYPPQLKPSMLIDLEQGNRLEVESIQGATVRLGKRLGVPTPVNRVIYAALKPHAAGAR
ncbi:MAG: 2-dehydropantoate 2-reductase [bacterium]